MGFWPGSEIEPFATFINAVPKYVATSTPLDPESANASPIDGGLVDFVRDLKNRPGGDIGVHASISVTQALLTAGVVDELRLAVAPTIAGVGRRLLDGLAPIRLAPIRSVISPTIHLILDYRVSRSARARTHLGDVIALALAIAASPLQVVPAIVLLFTVRPRPTSLAFLGGWSGGIGVVTALFTLFSEVIDTGGESPGWLSWVRIVVGGGLPSRVADS